MTVERSTCEGDLNEKPRSEAGPILSVAIDCHTIVPRILSTSSAMDAEISPVEV